MIYRAFAGEDVPLGGVSSVSPAACAPRTKAHLIEARRRVSSILLAVLLDALRECLGARRVILAEAVGGIVHQLGDGVLVDGLRGPVEIEVIEQFGDFLDLRQGEGQLKLLRNAGPISNCRQAG